jgi:hypothetical protein
VLAHVEAPLAFDVTDLTLSDAIFRAHVLTPSEIRTAVFIKIVAPFPRFPPSRLPQAAICRQRAKNW